MEYSLKDVEKNKPLFRDFEFLFERPAQVQVDLTNRCNLNCIYCYNKSNSLTSSECSDEDCVKVIKKIVTELNPLFVSFSGGEPLLRADLLFKLAHILKENNIHVHINTNGILITEKIAQKFKELDIDKININIDSFKKQDELRGGKNLLERVLYSLDLLKKYFYKERVSIACVITRLNYKEALELAHFVKNEGFMELHLLDMIPSEEKAKHLFLSKKEWLEFYEIYKQIKKLNIRIKPNHALLFLKEFEEYVKIPFCMAGRLKMVISADGSIVPCNYFKSKEFICGNALSDNLLDVWKNSEVMQKFRYFIPKDEKCQSCPLLPLCSGGCRAMAFHVLGDPFKADPYCTVYQLKDEQ